MSKEVKLLLLAAFAFIVYDSWTKASTPAGFTPYGPCPAGKTYQQSVIDGSWGCF